MVHNLIFELQLVGWRFAPSLFSSLPAVVPRLASPRLSLLLRVCPSCPLVLSLLPLACHRQPLRRTLRLQATLASLASHHCSFLSAPTRTNPRPPSSATLLQHPTPWRVGSSARRTSALSPIAAARDQAAAALVVPQTCRPRREWASAGRAPRARDRRLRSGRRDWWQRRSWTRSSDMRDCAARHPTASRRTCSTCVRACCATWRAVWIRVAWTCTS